MAPRPRSNDDLLTRVARLSYEVGLTHREIADMLGMSRATVTRLIADARSRGVVEITIRGPQQLFAELEREAVAGLGLAEVWLAPTIPGDAARTTEAVHRVGGRCIAEHAAQATIIAIGLSATVAGAVAAVPATARSDARIVPLAGGWGGPSRGLNPHEVARTLAERVGGRPYNLPAPVLVAAARDAETLLRLPDVSESLELARRADLAILGVGGYDWDVSALGRAVTPQERAELQAADAVGDVSVRFFDRSGAAIHGTLDDRVVGLTLDELRRPTSRIVVAHGPGKLDVLAGALAGSLPTVLVTDTDTVRGLLARPRP